MPKLVFLGTSDAQGVPRMLCSCDVCKNAENKNIRKRPSAYVYSKRNILIDASPDLREQFLTYSIPIPDFLLITHAHNDHIAGLGDFADLCFWNNRNVLVVSPEDVIEILKQRYPYLIKRKGLRFVSCTSLNTDDYSITFHKVNHGHNGYSYGIKFKGKNHTWAYVPDAIHMTEQQLEPFFNMDLLVLGSSYWSEAHVIDQYKRSIYDAQEAIEVKKITKTKKLILTHLSHDIDIPKHQKILPSNVEFAYDGMCLEYI